MTPSTLKKGNELIDKLEEVDEQLKLWPKLRKSQLRYNYDTAAYRDFKFIPDEVFEAFRLSTVNALKVTQMELTKELEDLAD